MNRNDNGGIAAIVIVLGCMFLIECVIKYVSIRYNGN